MIPIPEPSDINTLDSLQLMKNLIMPRVAGGVSKQSMFVIIDDLMILEPNQMSSCLLSLKTLFDAVH